MRRPDPTVVAMSFALLALLIVAWQQLNPAPTPTTPYQESHDPCIGDPIIVAYPYRGNPENPHECLVQCSDNRQRYILYSNGLGTQCDTPPSCNDRGEDDGVSCTPPTADVDSVR